MSTKNKLIQTLDRLDSETHLKYPAMEGAAIGEWAVIGAMIAAYFGLLGYVKWEDYKKSKEKPEKKDTGRGAEFRKIKKALGETFLNNAWLSEQQYKSGTVASGSFAKYLAINGTIDKDVLKKISDGLDVIDGLDSKMAESYYDFQIKVNKIMKPIETALITGNPSGKYISVDKINEELLELGHPIEKYWDAMPNHKTFPGGLYFERHTEAPQLLGTYHYTLHTKLPKPDTALPALDKEGVKNAAALVLAICEFVEKEGYELFKATESQLQFLPVLKDGWPTNAKHEMEDVLPEAKYDSPIYEVGRLSEDYCDPIYELDYELMKVLQNTSKALMMWIENSIVKQ